MNQVAIKDDDKNLVKILQSSLYPNSKSQSVAMVLDYCRATGLDPMQKPVHIVPMWDSLSGEMKDVIMPGIGLYRVQAARAGCCGISEPEFGPDVTEEFAEEQGKKGKLPAITLTYPAWCKITVKRMVNGVMSEFTAVERWKENYATASKFSQQPNAMWQKRPYAQLAKCFDEQTEVLTENGFELFSQTTGRILQVTESGLKPCDSKPFVQDYSGEMIVADGTRLNFSVTPNHDMVTTLGKIEAGDLYNQASSHNDKFYIPRAPAPQINEFDVGDSVLRLLGYFLADGCHTGYHQFRIAVSRPYKLESLNEIGLYSKVSIRKEAGNVAESNGRKIVTKTDKTVYTYDWSLISQFCSPNKMAYPDKILNLSSRQAKIVVDALLEFDGDENGSGTRRLSQKNKAVLRSFELAAVHAGYSISKHTERESDIGNCTSITISDGGHFPVVKNVPTNKASLVKRLNVTGKVWCVTVPSGVIVVRRKGFSMICGNCAEAQALRKGFPEIGSQPTAEEMEGKIIDMGMVQGMGSISATDGAMGRVESIDRKQEIQRLGKIIQEMFDAGNEYGAFEEYVSFRDTADADEQAALWKLLDSKCKSSIRSQGKQADETITTDSASV